MRYACIDLEGVLIPELWPLLSDRLGINELALTTREVPDLQSLMKQRLRVLRSQCVRFEDVQVILKSVKPLPGARDFLTSLAQTYQLVFLSDAFEQMVRPLVVQLGAKGVLRCHRFEVDDAGFIAKCVYAQRSGKQDVVKELQAKGNEVLAIGDAFNDVGMIEMADIGFLFRPSEQTAAITPHLTIVNSYVEIEEALGHQSPTPQESALMSQVAWELFWSELCATSTSATQPVAKPLFHRRRSS